MRVVSFFAGCGGLDLGFEQAGFEVVWANEFEPAVRKTYIKNHPRTEFVLRDINDIKPEEVPDCDGFIGGPPCQSWSVAGNQRGLEDDRGKLFLTYIEMIKVKKPRFFLIENVKGLLDDVFKDIFKMFIDKLNNAGYDVKWRLLDAVNYGVPQKRERVFIVGFRKELNIKFDFPEPTYSEPITLSDAIGDITELPNRYFRNEKIKGNNARANHDVLVSEYGQFYVRGNRRRGWGQPSFTIHATADNIPLHPASPRMVYYGNENWCFQNERINEYRRLSVRECARIQTFPDEFIFETEEISAAYKMIGNAVPPRLGNVLAQTILSVLQSIKTEKRTTRKSLLEEYILVGYFKNQMHHDCVVRNRIYYVRADGRRGSIFREDYEITPKYLFMHHDKQAELYELDDEEPVLVEAEYLKGLGFKCSGERYLCFRLKDGEKRQMAELTKQVSNPVYDRCKYAPYFTTLNKLIPGQ